MTDTRTPAADVDPGGLTGTALDVMETLGAPGVGLVILLETVVPPIPSEVVLPVAGLLVGTGRLPLLPVFLLATLGSVLGAVLLAQLGRWLGPDRSRRLIGRLPLVDARDVTRTFDWFDRQGRSAVLVGRLVPVVRSFISVPAGVVGMPWLPFVLLTAIGSGLWNAALIGAGMLLGTRYDLVEQYVGVLDRGLVLAVAGALVWLVVRRIRRGRRTVEG